MRLRLTLAVAALVVGSLAAVTLLAVSRSEAGVGYPLDQVSFESVVGGLEEPVDIAFTGVASDTRMFVVEREGRVLIVQGGVVLATPYLDISSKVDTSYFEEGLLGLAFAPDYGASGQFYVYYNFDLGGGNTGLRLSRFVVSSDPDVAAITETVVLTIPHPVCDNHNGGDLAFGPDGYLYLAPGDGGGANDTCGGGITDNDAQRLDSLLGKVLRIHVTGVPTYTVPATNPFTQTVNARPEIWAWGLRNPWRFSFDALLGDLYIGDVGQDAYEEVNLQPASSLGGENYGWRCYEGFHAHVACGSPGPFVSPILEYPHSPGDDRAVTGGYVYRGGDYPALDGYYFFADYISGRFWARNSCGGGVTALGKLLGNASPSTFGQDAAGEMYVADLGDFGGTNGEVFRLIGPVPAPPPAVETPVYLPLVTNGNC